MGNWNINIQGVGCHHNDKPEIDADLAAKEFVEKLKGMGLTVESATFTSGSKTDLHSTRATYVNVETGERFEAGPGTQWEKVGGTIHYQNGAVQLTSQAFEALKAGNL